MVGPPRTSPPSSDHNVSGSPYKIISLSSVEKSLEEKSNESGKKSGTPVTGNNGTRKAIHHKYSKLKARPFRRSSISAARKSDKGTRRLFVHKQKAQGKKEAKESGDKIVVSPEAPPKPPRAHEVEAIRRVKDAQVAEESGKG